MAQRKNPQLQAGLAIAGVLVQRYIFYPLITVSFVLFFGATLLIVLSVQHSPWWILLLIVVLLWLMLSFLFLLTSFAASRALQPRKLKTAEKKLITEFVKDFGVKYAALKGIQKSPTALAGIITWKFLRGRGKTSMAEIVTEPLSDAKELKNRFQKITDLFSDSSDTA